MQNGDQNIHQASELPMLQVNDQFYKTLSPGKCNSNYLIDAVLIEANDCIKTRKPIGEKKVVIELKDDDFDIDDDCVFVLKKKNYLPKGNNNSDPICVDDYVIESKCRKEVHSVDYYDVDDIDDIRIIDVKPFFKNKRSGFEVGESSGSKSRRNDDMVIEIDDTDNFVEEMTFLCEICADSKPRNKSFTLKGCSHSYCSDCMNNYVASKLQDGVSSVSCPDPGCCGVLEPEYCRDILPFEVFERWGNLLCESVILASQKFYCPFKDCSALLVDDGGESVTQAECPSCFRLFCAQCKVGWHDGIECGEYQKLNEGERQKEDIMLRNLAKDKNWQRCPVCKFYVEKSSGCLFIKCRCGIAFCYSCGNVNEDHRYHNCKKCGR